MAASANNYKYKVLFVCTGNICRSPTAEGIMKNLVKEAGLADKIYTDSAGTSSWHSGDCPDIRSIACAENHGLDLRDLRSRPVSAEDFAEFDLILGMDNSNIYNLETKRPHGDDRYLKAKVKKLLEYAPEYGTDVPDPYYHNGFEKVFEMIEKSCERLLEEIKQKLSV